MTAIAWVSTLAGNGQRNLAPHSYFSLVSSDPPVIHVTSSQRRGRLQGTARNIAETGEFVVNAANRERIELTNHTSSEWPPDEDEWTQLRDGGPLPTARPAGDAAANPAGARPPGAEPMAPAPSA